MSIKTIEELKKGCNKLISKLMGKFPREFRCGDIGLNNKNIYCSRCIGIFQGRLDVWGLGCRFPIKENNPNGWLCGDKIGTPITKYYCKECLEEIKKIKEVLK